MHGKTDKTTCACISISVLLIKCKLLDLIMLSFVKIKCNIRTNTVTGYYQIHKKTQFVRFQNKLGLNSVTQYGIINETMQLKLSIT